MLLRLAMSWLLLNDVPRLPSHDGWYWRTGGDQALYFQIAQSFVAGQPLNKSVSIGVSLLMAGVIKLTGLNDFRGILPWMVILHGFVLGLLSVWVMAQLTYSLTRSRWQALTAAALWTLSPYAIWLALGFHREAETLRDVYVSLQLWMKALTDPPSLFTAMLGILLVVLGGEAVGQKNRRWQREILFGLGGLSLGLAASLRFQTLAMSGMIWIALLWNRQWRGLALMSAGFLVGFSPQLWYNATVAGHVLNMPYVSGWLGFRSDGSFVFDWRSMQFSPQFFIGNLIFVARRQWVLALVGCLAVVIFACVVAQCWRRRGSFAALVMFGVPLASLALHIVTYVFAIDPIRFSLPALSMGIPGGVWAVFFVASKLQAKIISLRPTPGAKGTL